MKQKEEVVNWYQVSLQNHLYYLHKFRLAGSTSDLLNQNVIMDHRRLHFYQASRYLLYHLDYLRNYSRKPSSGNRGDPQTCAVVDGTF